MGNLSEDAMDLAFVQTFRALYEHAWKGIRDSERV